MALVHVPATGTDLPQHMTALQRGNMIRLKRAALKRQILAGDTLAADVILDPPEEAANMTVSDLLCAQRRWGASRAMKLCRDVAVGENRRIGALTPRQAHALAGRLRLNGAPGVLGAREQPFPRPPAPRPVTPPPPPRHVRPVVKPVVHPPGLSVDCPYCAADPGEPCGYFDHARSTWVDTTTHSQRINAERA